jgi:hypothetical protein
MNKFEVLWLVSKDHIPCLLDNVWVTHTSVCIKKRIAETSLVRVVRLYSVDRMREFRKTYS